LAAESVSVLVPIICNEPEPEITRHSRSSLQMIGTNTLTLSAANTYSGATSIGSGTSGSS